MVLGALDVIEEGEDDMIKAYIGCEVKNKASIPTWKITGKTYQDVIEEFLEYAKCFPKGKYTLLTENFGEIIKYEVFY